MPRCDLDHGGFDRLADQRVPGGFDIRPAEEIRRLAALGNAEPFELDELHRRIVVVELREMRSCGVHPGAYMRSLIFSQPPRSG